MKQKNCIKELLLKLKNMKKQTEKEILKLVEKNYEDIAKEYGETRKKKIWPELQKYLDKIKDRDSVLDIGCGSGKILQAIGNKKIKYLGIDKSNGLLDFAKKNYPTFDFKKGDIFNLGDVAGIEYDWVFCIAVLHHIPSFDLQVKALRQMKNKIRNNGRIVLSVWNLWEQKKYRKLILKFWLLRLIKKNKMDFGDILFDWIGPNKNISKRYYHAFTKRQLKTKLMKRM